MTKYLPCNILRDIMSADHRPYVPERLPPVTITDQAEREYFKDLSKRLLLKIGGFMVVVPPAAALGDFVIHESAQRVGSNLLTSLYSNPGDGVLTGLVVGVAFSAREIWKVRNERFPRS